MPNFTTKDWRQLFIEATIGPFKSTIFVENEKLIDFFKKFFFLIFKINIYDIVGT